MKKLLTILCLVLLSSYSYSEEVPKYKLVERQGITYKVNSTTPFTGSSVEYHWNGQLEEIRNYKDGKIHGLVKWFRVNGQLQERRNHKNGEQEGLNEWFYENGQLKGKGN